jgi:hypothetical protein
LVQTIDTGAAEIRSRIRVIPGNYWQFSPHLLIFTAVLWGAFARGAFYRLDLIVFTGLCIAAGLLAILVRKTASVSHWWLITAALPAGAVLISATTTHTLSDAPYALAPIVAAASLGLSGSVMGSLSDRFTLSRIVANVTALLAGLSWLGVALHLQAFAQPLNQGWRASATIGYTNVTGLFLLIGLLCSVALAVRSGRVADELRCSLLLVGVLTTQSRSVVLALVVCGLVLFAVRRPMAVVLLRTMTWALVAFAGLLPSVRGTSTNPLIAIASALAVAGLLWWMHRREIARVVRVAVLLLAAGATVLGVVVLRTRIFDVRSEGGRLQLWQDAFQQFRPADFFGQGPHQLSALSSGQTVALLLHNDVLQYAVYYGVPGLVALASVCWRVGFQLARTRTGQDPDSRTIALTICIATAVVALVDFPFQVPLIPAVVSLVVGVCLQLGVKPQGADQPATPATAQTV